MKRLALLATAGVALSAVLVGVSALGVERATPTATVQVQLQRASFVARPGATLDELIAQLEARVEAVPQDHTAWATLGLAYVQQAHVTGDGDLYPLAEQALATSLQVSSTDNHLAYAGKAALAAAGHDFVQAREHALTGIAINEYSPLLHGALSDAELHLGNYDEAFAAVQRMVDLSPDTTSLARASYAWELRGDLDRATALMQRALEDAPTPEDRAFALLHLGNLAFSAGDANTALEHYLAALGQQPDSAAAQAGRARALAALGQVETALDAYRELIARGLEPFYILQYADLLASLGRTSEAAEQYALYEQQESQHAAREVLPEPVFTLFFADHGKPELALEKATKGVQVAPFLDTWDAYAWALHANGRHQEAWEAMQEALALGTRSALYEYHAGMIRLALGDEDGAREHLEAALETNPHFSFVAAETARETLAELD